MTVDPYDLDPETAAAARALADAYGPGVVDALAARAASGELSLPAAAPAPSYDSGAGGAGGYGYSAGGGGAGGAGGYAYEPSPYDGTSGGPSGAPDPLTSPPPAPPRMGVTVPGDMITDGGHMVAVPPTPRPVMRRGPPPVQLPPQYADGQYFPPGNDIELARLRGDISDPQARLAERSRDQWLNTVPGLGAQMTRQQLANEGAQLDAMQPVFDAQSTELRARQDQFQRLQDFQASERLAQQQRREVYERELQAQQDKYNLALQDIAATKIDGSRLTKTTEQKIARGIRGFLGALGAALLGRPNETAQEMAADIDRDIAVQRANLDSKRQSAEAQRGVLGIMRQRYGDMEQAQTAARQFYYQELDSELARTELETRDVEQKTRIGMLRQELGQRAQLNELALQQQGQARADALAQQRMLLMMRGQQQPKGAAGKDLDARFVPGFGIAPNTGTADKMRELLATTKTGHEMIDKLLMLSQQTGKSVSPTARAQAAALSNMLLIQVNKAGGLGALDAGSQQLLSTIVADPTQALSLDSANQARLNTLREHFSRQLNSQAQATGFVPARREVTGQGAQYHYGEEPGRAPTAARFKPVQ